MYYTQRTLGDTSRVNEKISFIFWEKLTQIFKVMYEKDFFSNQLPLNYPILEEPYSYLNDFFAGCTYGCDSNKLNKEIEFLSNGELCWPLQTSKKVITETNEGCQSHSFIEEWKPSEYQVFDLIEYLYSITTTPQYHYLQQHDDEIRVLSLDKKNNWAKKYFIKEINKLLLNGRMIYELDPELGQIRAILSDETKKLTYSALNCGPFYHDSEYLQMLEDACIEISGSKLKQSYEALKKLWDAFERLKCYFDPKSQKEKKDSSQKIVDLFSNTPLFKYEVSLEMKHLSDLGNTLTIRHSETYQEVLQDRRQINYLFNRCLSMIVLIQHQIVETEKQK